MRILVLLLLGLLPAGCVWAAAQPAAHDLDEVLVVGRLPGPGLWKVSRGEHVLWLLGTPELLPARMEWDTSRIDAVMARSQAFITGPRVSIKGGPLTLFRLYRQWRRMQQTDEHAPLAVTLPAALHARFEALRGRYAPRERDWEKLRPMLAADRLFDAAVARSGLRRGGGVRAAVSRIAAKRHVKVQRIELQIDEPERLLREVAETPAEAEMRCMEATVARVETDMEASARRAAAWARGDLQEIRSLRYADNRNECAEAIATSTARVRSLLDRAQESWLQAADAALVANVSTVAIRPIQDLLRPDGVLRSLQLRGYRVEEP